MSFVKSVPVWLKAASAFLGEDSFEKASRSVAGGISLALSRLWCAERKRLYETISRVYHRMNLTPPRELGDVIDRVFMHFGLFINEFLLLPNRRRSEISDLVKLHGLEHLHEAMARGRGVILVVPHMGNWELLGAAIVNAGFPLNSFYLSQKYDEIGSVIDYFRSFTGITLHDRDRAGINALRALKRGEVLGMIPDQDGGNNGVYSDFLGHYVSIPAGPANWSLKTGAAVVPLYSVRRGLSKYFDGWFFPALPEENGATHCEKVVSRTLRIKTWLEKIILRHPDQYLWFYDRFKPRHHQFLGKAKAQGYRFSRGSTIYATPDMLSNG